MFSRVSTTRPSCWPKAACKSVYESRRSGQRPASGCAGPAGSRPLCIALRALRGAGPRRRRRGDRRGAGAAETGVRVILCDEQAELGGALRFESARDRRQGRWTWAQETVAKLAAMDNVPTCLAHDRHRLLRAEFRRARRAGHRAHGPADPALPRERLWQVRAGRVILAAVAIERPHGVRRKRPAGHPAGVGRADLSQPPRRARPAEGRVYTANDSAYAAAVDMKKPRDVTIVDLRDNPHGSAVESARAAGIEINTGRAILKTAGKLRVSSMTVAPKNGGAARTIDVDAILMSADGHRRSTSFPNRAARSPSTTGRSVFLPGTYAQDCVSRRRLRRHRGACGNGRGSAAAGSEGCPGGERQEVQKAPAIAAATTETLRRRHGRCRAGRRTRHHRKGLRRFPERRHREGHPARGARRHCARSSM